MTFVLPLARTIILTDNGTAAFSAKLAAYDGTPIGPISPLPPAFAGQPSFQSDGTPQVGEQLTGVDAPVLRLGAAVLRRAWLLGVTVITEDAAFTPDDHVTYTFRNQLVVAGVVVATVSVDVVVGAASGPHQLLAPAVQSSTPEDSSSAAWQLTPAADESLPEGGYTGFGIKLERATNASFTAGYVSEVVVMTSPAFAEGFMRRPINHDLPPGATYQFGFTIIPPAGEEANYKASARVVKTLTIAAAVAPQWDAETSTGTLSNNRTTGANGADSAALFTETAHGRDDTRYWLEAIVDSDHDFAYFGLWVDGAHNCVIQTRPTFDASQQCYFANGGGGSQAFYSRDADLAKPLAAKKVALLFESGKPGAVGYVTFYRGDKRTERFQIVGGNNFGSVVGKAGLDPANMQVTLTATSVKPAGVQDWTGSAVVVPGKIVTGDSWPGDDYAGRYAGYEAQQNPTKAIYVEGVGGSTLIDLNNRQQAVIDRQPTHIHVGIGRNDMMAYASAQAYFDAISAHLQRYRAALPDVVLGVETLVEYSVPNNPGYTTDWNVRRRQYNPLLRAAKGKGLIDVVVDFAANSSIGDDGDMTPMPQGLNCISLDGLHLFDRQGAGSGQDIASVIYANAWNAAYAAKPLPTK